jgi:hypothetical protein
MSVHHACKVRNDLDATFLETNRTLRSVVIAIGGGDGDSNGRLDSTATLWRVRHLGIVSTFT